MIERFGMLLSEWRRWKRGLNRSNIGRVRLWLARISSIFTAEAYIFYTVVASG